MRNTLTIFRREFMAYFTSPIGYIFLAAFILFTNLLGLFIFQPWFDYPEPNLRLYFYVLLGVSTFFVAAITMRLWADERRGNTFEMLLTLPMRARELVLGKFMAGMVFYAIALALTLTVPVMVARVTQLAPDALAGAGGALGWWGAVDTGALVSAYLGAFLAGCVFMAFGLFVSGLCQDQIVAFVLTAPTLFLAYLLGVPPIQSLIDSALDFVLPHGGRLLGSTIGIFDHYQNMVRGLVNVTDVLFFLLWTGLFLFLNALTLERRGRAGANLTHAVAIALVFAIGGVFNAGVLGDARLGRLDVTRDQVFTVSPITRRILGQLEDQVRLRYHVTPRDQLPVELQSTEREVVDKLEALANASGGQMTYEVVYRQESADAAGEDKEEGDELRDSLDAQAVRRVEPFQYATRGSDKAAVQLVYSGIEVVYSDKAPEVLLPQIVNAAETSGGNRSADVAMLEFAVVDYIHRATRKHTPVVALVAPRGPEWPPELVQMHFQRYGQPPPPPEDPYDIAEMILGRAEGYDLRRVTLVPGDTLPDNADLVVVIGPENLGERQVYELARALSSGTPMILAVQRQTMRYGYEIVPVRLRDGGLAQRPVWRRHLDTIAPGVEKLLPEGIRLDTEMLMDRPENCFTHLLAPGPFGRPVWTPYDAWPMHVQLTTDNLDVTLKQFEGVPSLRWLWGNTIGIDEDGLKERGIATRILARSGATSWRKLLAGNVVTEADMRPPAADAPATLAAGRFPLIALFEGPFPFPFAERPDWPMPEPTPQNPMPAPPPDDGAPFTPPEVKPGQLLLLANAYLWHRNGFDRGRSFPPELNFLMNAAAIFVMDNDSLDVRDLRQKTFAPPVIGSLAAAQRRFWKTVQVGGHVAVITLAGVAVWLCRRRRREAFQLARRENRPA